jgi:UDPglucose 6-dehydrogenase
VNVAVIGTGYVGLVVGACLAEAGNNVICADTDADKIEGLRRGRIPIYEPGLEALVVKNQECGRLAFTADVGRAVEVSKVIFIAVATPPDEDGTADLQHVLSVARVIGDHLNAPKIVITKSTVPAGTGEQVRAAIAELTDVEFHICYNPEFLKQGAAVEDFMKPDRVVVGVDSEEAALVLRELYAPFVRSGNPLIFMDTVSAEVTKYAANAMLAVRISFMNEIAALCEAVGADIDSVRCGIGSDPRIGNQYLFPGPGYGGSCLPKDVKALVATGAESGVELGVAWAADVANTRQKKVLLKKLQAVLGRDLAGATIAVWGLSFKAQTDDMRESPSLDLIDGLLRGGAIVRVHDPRAGDAARRILAERVDYLESPYDVLEGADAMVVATEWMEYRNPDFERMKQLLARPIIVDGRNLYDPERMRRMGFAYVGVGRRPQA